MEFVATYKVILIRGGENTLFGLHSKKESLFETPPKINFCSFGVSWEGDTPSQCWRFLTSFGMYLYQLGLSKKEIEERLKTESLYIEERKKGHIEDYLDPTYRKALIFVKRQKKGA